MIIKRNLAFPLAISLLLHISLVIATSFRKKNAIYVTIPVELSFYNASPAAAGAQARQESEKARLVMPKTDDIVIPKKARKDKKEKREETTVQKQKAEDKAVPDEKTGQAAGHGSGRATGTAGGPITLDTANFPYAYYTNLIVKKIGSNWQWSTGFGHLKAVVYFRILRDGHIAEIDVRESSNDKLFDQQALRAVRLGSPFPPLPVGYSEDSLGVFFEFSFKE